MTRTKYPPLPTLTRPLFWLLRIFGIAIALGAISVAGLALRAGRWDLAAMVLAVSWGFSAMTWIHPLSDWFSRTLIVVGLAASFLAFQATGRLWLALAFIPIVLIGVFRRPLARSRILVNLDPGKVQIAAPGLVMKNAEAFQKDFLDNGFISVGATTFVIRGATVVSSLLISPDRHSNASVTDSILHVTSVFGGGRVLVTRNNDVSPMPAYVLTNGLSGATPRELIGGHADALALLAAHDHHPIRLVADEIPQRAVDSDRDGIVWLTQQRDLKMKPDDRGPVVGRKNLPLLIDAWVAASSEANQDGTGPTT